MQLNKYLALCGAASRRKAVDPILQGRVTVNGEPVRTPAHRIDPETDSIRLDDRLIAPPAAYRYVLLNKPPGVLTTVDDDRNRETVVSLISASERLFPVGRLDQDTTGVLLLTNDGELAYRLMHPKYEIDKIYEARIKGEIGEDTAGKLSRGVAIDPGVIVSGVIRIVEKNNGRSVIWMTIHEGKKRQVKRMMKAVGHPVEALERIRFAGLTVKDLKQGAWRNLKKDEVARLYQITGLKKDSK